LSARTLLYENGFKGEGAEFKAKGREAGQAETALNSPGREGSHGRLTLNGKATTVKDLRKEIGPNLLKAMCAQLGLKVKEVENA
jgi:hypothetical protein